MAGSFGTSTESDGQSLLPRAHLLLVWTFLLACVPHALDPMRPRRVHPLYTTERSAPQLR
jgi:hypothetical protein